MLRAANRSCHHLEIHTNPFSAKVEELRHTPVAALHVRESWSSLQIRLQADVTIIIGAGKANAWVAPPERSRLAHGIDYRPGKPTPSPLTYDQTPDPEAYAILRLKIRVMDLLHLDVHSDCQAQLIMGR